MEYEVILQAFWLILPAYIANGSAVLVGGGTPIDFGKTWRDGKRILGDGKTWRGLFAGAILGMIGGFGLSVVAIYAKTSDFAFLGLNDFGRFPIMIPIEIISMFVKPFALTVRLFANMTAGHIVILILIDSK